MSHFSVVVCTEDPSKLEEVMEPWNENTQVDPYRDYEKGEASGHWLYTSLKRTVDDLAKGTGLLPYEPDKPGVSNSYSSKTTIQQLREQQADAALFATLPDPVSWADIVKLNNDRYGDEDRLLLSEDGRAYTMSTYNPESKWDYWRIGGRWGGYFPYKPGHVSEVIQPQRGWDSPDIIAPVHCDGGPKSALDLAALRREKEDKARKTHAEFAALVEGTPEARPWSEFYQLTQDLEGYDIDQARTDYHSQPRVERIKGSDFQWWDDPIPTLQQSVERYVLAEQARAVPGYAIVTTDGRWMAPGKMGWWGMSSDDDSSRIGYWEAANAYIDALPDSVFLIALDCHI